jgi:hypothetical protein
VLTYTLLSQLLGGLRIYQPVTIHPARGCKEGVWITAGDVGIEPTLTVLETVVIPFHQSPLRHISAKGMLSPAAGPLVYF